MNASLLMLSIASLGAGVPDGVYDFSTPWCGYCQQMMPMVDRLHAEGLPLYTIDAEQRPELARQFGVSGYPTFVLVIDGRKQSEVSGMQSESTLRKMLAQVPRPTPHKKAPVRLASDDAKQGSGWNFHLPLPAFPGKKEDVVQIEPASQGANSRLQGVRVEPERPTKRSARNRNTDPDSNEEAPAADNAATRPLATSVRIRVRDAGGVYFGSGVVIESLPGKTTILTCGHILRDAKRDSQIEVDLFSGNRSRTYRGTIVKFDLEADVGLVMVPTPASVPASIVAAAHENVRIGDAAVSVGCSGGELPTVEKLRVTTLNRYLGPDTIECTGVPVQGRSGGGLFTADSRVVGVCTNADPREKRGVYAGLAPIHALLRSAGFEHLVPGAAKSDRDALAANEKGETAADETGNPTRSASLERELGQAEVAPPRRAATGRRKASDGSRTGEMELAGKALEEAEVVCIIRDVKHPNAASRVVIINRATPTFMSFLTGEAGDRLVPTMETRPADEADDPAPKQSNHVEQESRDEPRTSSAWKRSEMLPMREPTALDGARIEKLPPAVPPIESRVPHRYVRSDDSRD